MGLFKNKPKLIIEECCKQFYDSQILFSPIIGGQDMGSFYWDSVFNSIVEADNSFARIDKALFQRETTALHMALFMTAFTIRVKLKLEYMVRQVLFTKRYLQDNRRLDLWDVMLKYNDVIDHSASTKADGQPLDSSSPTGRARITFLNSYRWGLFKEWIKSNMADPQSPTFEEKEKLECLAIVLKLVGASMTGSNCVAVKLLGGWVLTMKMRFRCQYICQKVHKP